MLATSPISKGYRIGDHFPGIYLSYTELQIVAGLLRGKKAYQIAIDIGISHRTVNYYCLNMMKLLGCDEVDALIDCIRSTELYQYIDC